MIAFMHDNSIYLNLCLRLVYTKLISNLHQLLDVSELEIYRISSHQISRLRAFKTKLGGQNWIYRLLKTLISLFLIRLSYICP